MKFIGVDIGFGDVKVVTSEFMEKFPTAVTYIGRKSTTKKGLQGG